MTGGSAGHSRRSPLLASAAPVYRLLAVTKATLNGVEKIYNSINISGVLRLFMATWAYGCHLQYVPVGWSVGSPPLIDEVSTELAWIKILSYAPRSRRVVRSRITYMKFCCDLLTCSSNSEALTFMGYRAQIKNGFNALKSSFITYIFL